MNDSFQRVESVSRPENQNQSSGTSKLSEEKKTSLTSADTSKDFNTYIGKDGQLRDAHSSLRRLAVVLFVSAILSTVVGVADIEVTRQARFAVAQALHCDDTYLLRWQRYCQPLIDGINISLPNGTAYASQTYFRRWFNVHMQYAFDSTVAGMFLKICLTLLTGVNICGYIMYHKINVVVMQVSNTDTRHRSCLKTPKLKELIAEMLFGCFHIPPLCDAWLQYELQIIVLSRLYICSIKILKECNELRYNRLGNVLFKLAGVKIHSTFLIRSHFLHHPKTMLFIIYFIVIGCFSYVVMVSEHIYGNPLTYLDSAWLMMVTITNLGSGEIRPQGVLARAVVGIGSMIGVFSTALWVNVFSKYLDLPNEEKRILTLIEFQTYRKLEKRAAAMCIQAQWRKVLTYKKFGAEFKRKRSIADKRLKKALWEWKVARQNYNQLRRVLESRFAVEDTLMVAQNLDRRLSNQINPSETTLYSRRESRFSQKPNAVKPLGEIKNNLNKFQKLFNDSSDTSSKREDNQISPTSTSKKSDFTPAGYSGSSLTKSSSPPSLHQQAVLTATANLGITEVTNNNEVWKKENKQTSNSSPHIKNYARQQAERDVHMKVLEIGEDDEFEDEPVKDRNDHVINPELLSSATAEQKPSTKRPNQLAMEDIVKSISHLTKQVEAEKTRSVAFYKSALEEMRRLETNIHQTCFAAENALSDGVIQ